ncbi:hypothetical protein CEQ90_04970 [Lewinellaceae bacterium SD302]|nr:hypothetical protein CEQ90_04970 [Lewinellaceae bacterium SD302]
MTIVLLGIVVMINGCNGLISQNFGTHKLRTVALQTVLDSGMGDADFVRLEEAELTDNYLIGEALTDDDEDYHLHAILTPEQAAAYTAGEKVTAGMVGWYKIPYEDCVKNGDCQYGNQGFVEGLITEPTDRKNPVESWPRHNIELAEEVIYLQLWKAPLAWYWNLLMFLGGLGVAMLVEGRYQYRKSE